MKQFVLCKGKQEFYCFFKPTMIDSGNLANICTDWSSRVKSCPYELPYQLRSCWFFIGAFRFKDYSRGLFSYKAPG